MNSLQQYADWQEWLAIGFFIFCWIGYSRYAEHSSRQQKSLLAVTNGYRLQWMREMLKRDNRMPDAAMVGNLLRSITFFANTSIFILIGLMTMLSYHDKAAPIIGVIPFSKEATGFFWELKILLLILIFIYAFFKYTWSLRQYNYLGVFVVASPASQDRVAEHDAIAIKGWKLVSNAAKHFNDGLRAYYFGLAVLPWFIHPWLFMAATALVVFVVYRREYRSATLDNLAN